MKSVIILTHGMSVLGIDDPRILDLANNLCRSGYEIYLPEFEEVKSLKITPDTSHHMFDVFIQISEIAQNEKKRVGVFSISFTGGMGLIALSKNELRGKINSILVLGGFSHFGKIIESSFQNFEYDNYPAFLFLFNFVNLVFEKAEKLESIFWESALDNALSRSNENSVASKMITELAKEEKEFYLSFLKDSKFRNEIRNKIVEKLNNLIELNSPINYVENLIAPISIIHGKDDKVIPESESISIANILERKRMPYNLEITELLSHGDRVPIWKKIRDIPRLMKAFGYFFSHL